jgi:uncharacterized RDD family membrane protein YckC
MTNGAIYCNRCGAENSVLARFCAKCGTPFASDASVPPTTAELPNAQGPVAQPPAVQFPTPVPYASPAVRYGGFWIRFVAVAIDWLIVSVVVWPVAWTIAVGIGFAGGAVRMPGGGVKMVREIVLETLFLCAAWIYEAAMESSSKQATLGKMALGLKVTDEQGRRISFARATARYFSKFISFMILFIGYIMAGFTARKQALHDMIAGTLVTRTL